MELNHHRVGSGDPIVLLHGIGMSWQAWQPVIDRVAREREVIAIDLPGFGGSPTLPAATAPTAPNMAAAVAGFIRELGLEPPTVGGLSLGGWVALELAKLGVPRAVTAISPAGFWNRAENAYAQAQLRLTMVGARLLQRVPDRLLALGPVHAALVGGMYGRPDRVPFEEVRRARTAFVGSTAYYATLAAMHRGRFCGGGEIRVPVTIAWGTRDRLLLPRQANRAAAEIPGARLVWLRGAGHIPFHDDPGAVADAVLSAATPG